MEISLKYKTSFLRLDSNQRQLQEHLILDINLLTQHCLEIQQNFVTIIERIEHTTPHIEF